MSAFRIDRLLLGWLALACAQLLAGMIVRVKAPPVPYALEWMLVTDLLIVAVVSFLAYRSDWTGWKLAGALVLIPFLVNLVNMVEGTVFLQHSGIEGPQVALSLGLTYLFAWPLWRFTFGRQPATAEQPSMLRVPGASGLLWRFVLSDVAYLVLYFVAGMIIFPFVRDFYATQTVPPYRTIVALQLLLRGPVFILVCVLVVRMLGLLRWPGALVVGLAFTLVSGVAPLLAPNPFFPDAVRWVHFGEVVISNFVFGLVVALLWTRAAEERKPRALAQAA